MDSNSIQYSVFQKIRCQNWASRKTEPSNALVQVLPQGVRILLSLAENDAIVAFDEIQFTTELSVEEQINQFRHFIPQSILAEAAVNAVTIATEARFFCLLPVHLFSEQVAEASLADLSDIPFPFTAMHEILANDMVIVFAVPNAWLDWTNQVFSQSELKWTCSLTGLLDYSLGRKPNDSKEVYAQIDPKSFLAVCVENGRLLFANHFQFKTENDLLYFLLLVMDEMGLAPETNKVWLSGSILAGSSGFEKLNRYFGDLNFVKSTNFVQELAEEDFLHHHLNFDLICLHKKLLTDGKKSNIPWII
jgi:hypothetical protein